MDSWGEVYVFIAQKLADAENREKFWKERCAKLEQENEVLETENEVLKQENEALKMELGE